MTRALGPISLSIWDEPGLLIEGFDQPPMVMMGHHRPDYRGVDRGRGLRQGQGPAHLRARHRQGPDPADRPAWSRRASAIRASASATSTSRSFDAEAAIILNLLNDAWSDNWGFVPLTDAEIAYAGKKLKPIIYRGPGPHRRSRRRAGRVHADHARHQRADPRPQRRAVPVRLGQIAVAAAQAAT